MLPLTKFLSPADYQDLAPELTRVDEFDLSNQHTHRRWEYAMALRAVKVWLEGTPVPPGLMQALDVGGAGSPLADMLTAQFGLPCRVVDPSLPGGRSIQEYILAGEPPVAVVTCVSVIEHVPDDYAAAFLSALTGAVKPGGLLFLTTDAREDDPVSSFAFPKDDRHFSWMRSRIFSPLSWMRLVTSLEQRGFGLLSSVEWKYHGPQVYDYTFCSTALVRK